MKSDEESSGDRSCFAFSFIPPIHPPQRAEWLCSRAELQDREAGR